MKEGGIIYYLEFRDFKVYFRTSYFYNLRFFKKNYLPVSICIWDPKWYKEKEYMNYSPLIPKKYDNEKDCEACIKEHKDDPLYNGDLNCNYIKNYREQLSHYNLERTLLDIAIKANKHYDFNKYCNKDKEIFIVFMGFEVPSKLCSERFTLSKWIKSGGCQIFELSDESLDRDNK